MANTLILGGTRNLGHSTAIALLEQGHRVSILNRGITQDELPSDVERLRADRSDDEAMRRAIGGRSFDMIVDTTTYNEREAQQAVALFSGMVGRYVFISSGQVYLVREQLTRPFHELDYAGAVMKAPDAGSVDYDSWLYGADKRGAEDVFARAFSESEFPATTLRLPMVASERDHHGRIQAYIARVMDGSALLVPEGRSLPIRHVYVVDVARLISRLPGTSQGIGEACNISCGTSMYLDEFLQTLGKICDRNVDIIVAKRDSLETTNLLPACSPFSGRWMSELSNERSATLMGESRSTYTEPAQYLASIAEDYANRWVSGNHVPAGYEQRPREIEFLRMARPG